VDNSDEMAAGSHDRKTPQTAGELRRVLAERGLDWQVDPRLRDDDHLLVYPTGGIMETEIAGAERWTGDFAEYLRRIAPANPFLRARWVELGILDEGEAPHSPGTAPGDGKHEGEAT
jgi:hypothetical protein